MAEGRDDGKIELRFLVAVVAEVIYLIGRTVLISSVQDDFFLEIVRTGWRLLFVGFYVWLFFDAVANRAVRRSLPPSPTIFVSMVIAAATIPLVHHGSPFDLRFAVLDLVAIPVVAFREELFYRVIVQSSLEKTLGPVTTVLTATTLFSLSHIGAQPMSLATISSFFALGFVSGVIYQYTRSLWIVVALHALSDYLVWLPYSAPIAPSIGFAGNVIAVFVALSWWWRVRPNVGVRA